MTAEHLKRSVESMGMAPVPAHMAIAKEPKLVDLTSINVYPSKYRIVNGEIIIKSINIENIDQQREALVNLNTTVLVGDLIKLDFKFGHYKNGEWIDLFVKAIFRVKEFMPNPKTSEILVKVTKVKELL